LNNDTLDEDQKCNNAAVLKLVLLHVPFIVSLSMAVLL